MLKSKSGLLTSVSVEKKTALYVDVQLTELVTPSSREHFVAKLLVHHDKKRNTNVLRSPPYFSRIPDHSVKK